MVNTQHSVKMMCCRTVHLKPVNFFNQHHLNKFKKKKKADISSMLTERKRARTKVTNIRNERGDIITDPTKIKRIIKKNNSMPTNVIT